MLRAILVTFALLTPNFVAAQEEQSEAPMTVERVAEILLALDPDTTTDGRNFQLTIEDLPIVVITDTVQDRIRAMIPVRSASGIGAAELQRLMQANFDTTLDARYAVADGRLWSVFIHPLRALEKDQLISGIGQTVNLVVTYGSLYTSGVGQFGPGDSQELHRQLIQRLQDLGEAL